MNFRGIVATIALLALPLLLVATQTHIARSASYAIRQVMLFNGSAVDSGGAIVSSPWFPVEHASHIELRSWSSKAAFSATTDADSQYTDSISIMTVLFSDSVSFMARDSAGVRVTASSLIPTTTSHGNPYPICADSVSVGTLTATGFVVDSVTTLIGVHHAPVNVALRAPGNGSGFLTGIFPTIPVGVAAFGDGEIHKRYMKVVITPRKRNTAAMSLATVPNRTIGLKGFKMQATIYSQDAH